jgi:23S rRNA (adenine2503-C2)-methyltransferase
MASRNGPRDITVHHRSARPNRQERRPRVQSIEMSQHPSSESAVIPFGSLFDATPDTLARWLNEKWGAPPFRARQILEWIYEKGAESFERMSNLPKDLRTVLAGELPLYASEVVRRQESNDGTIKILLRWPDGATSESVLIPESERRTACISTQVGCPVQCAFCASGLHGLQRQLTAGQIVEQAMQVRRLCEPRSRLSNVVFMGLGEPLANYAATLHAVSSINAEWGMGIGARKITVSTVGLPGPMRRLADEKLQITLALSLHAPTDELRKQIIPWAERVSIDSLVDAANYYFQQTGREITLEYILLGGFNDGEVQAQELVKVARRMRSNVNLIAYNPVAGLAFDRPSRDAVERFESHLRRAGVNTHLRRSRGLDIDAACGQLRRQETPPATLSNH